MKAVRDSSGIVSEICPMGLQLPQDYPNYSKKAVHSFYWCAKHCTDFWFARALKRFAKLSMIENLRIEERKRKNVVISQL